MKPLTDKEFLDQYGMTIEQARKKAKEPTLESSKRIAEILESIEVRKSKLTLREKLAFQQKIAKYR